MLNTYIRSKSLELEVLEGWFSEKQLKDELRYDASFPLLHM